MFISLFMLLRYRPQCLVCSGLFLKFNTDCPHVCSQTWAIAISPFSSTGSSHINYERTYCLYDFNIIGACTRQRLGKPSFLFFFVFCFLYLLQSQNVQGHLSVAPCSCSLNCHVKKRALARYISLISTVRQAECSVQQCH